MGLLFVDECIDCVWLVEYEGGVIVWGYFVCVVCLWGFVVGFVGVVCGVGLECVLVCVWCGFVLWVGGGVVVGVYGVGLVVGLVLVLVDVVVWWFM
jgi:hypothetical protein